VHQQGLQKPAPGAYAEKPEVSVQVLVVNAGSSTLKLSLLDPDDRTVTSSEVPAGGSTDQRVADAIGDARVDAVGHRFVHGGQDFTAPVLVDDATESRLRALVPLAPLHQPAALAGLEAVRAARPDLPQVACFDTAFHSTLPPAATTYAVPREWREAHGLRRYGFHGLSHAYATRRAADLLGGMPKRLVTCHLGAGASLAAVQDGRCVDTTMGFTPLEGLVMATRSGTVDPGLVLWLQTHAGRSAEEVEQGLLKRSGLLGLAGTADMREVLAGDFPDARLALDVYLHRLCALIASMTASLGGLDALLFTGGVGERAGEIRARVAERLAFLGVELDAAANAAAGDHDVDVATAGSPVRALVVHAREDLQISGEVRATLQQ
jgi:acetate kinase